MKKSFSLTSRANFQIILIENGFQFLTEQNMPTDTAIKLLPIVSADKKLEVTLEDGKALVKLSTWVEDLGWCGQKTLPIDVEMLDDLHRAIAAARYKVNKQNFADKTESVSANIIEFPGSL
jgi:hypothetical protein